MRFARVVLLSFLIAVVFTLVDALFHYFVPYLAIYSGVEPKFLIDVADVPLLWYAIGKFLGAFVLGLLIWGVGSLITRKNYLVAFVYSFFVPVVLQLRYIFTGYYGVLWNVIVLALHISLVLAISLLLSSLSFFKKRRY